MAKRNPAAVIARCVQLHKARLETFGRFSRCDFPLPEQPTAAWPAEAPDLETAVAGKIEAFVAVQNTIVVSFRIAKNLREYQLAYERMQGEGAQLDPNAGSDFGFSEFDWLIERLQAALALPASVPEVDVAAAALLQALEDVNPLVAALNRYQTTQEFKEDPAAHERHPVFVLRMTAAARAVDAYGDAVFNRTLPRDERNLASLPDGSLLRRMLDADVHVRWAVRWAQALLPGPGIDNTEVLNAFVRALDDTATSNRSLAMALDEVKPKLDQACISYGRTVDRILEQGRGIAQGERTKRPWNRAMALRFSEFYHQSMADMRLCREQDTDSTLLIVAHSVVVHSPDSSGSFAKQIDGSSEQTADERAIAEDYKDSHDGRHTWVIEEKKIRPSPDGSHLVTTEYGHIEPYFVSPPTFSRVLVGKRDEDRSKDILVYGVWHSRGTPDVEWLQDGRLQLTIRRMDDFYRCRHRAADVDVVHVLGQEMSLEPYRRSLDDKVRRMEQTQPQPRNERHQQSIEMNAALFKRLIEEDWQRYLKYIENARSDTGTDKQCFVLQ